MFEFTSRLALRSLGVGGGPKTSGGGGGDSNAALLLLLHPVHNRRAFMHLADAVRDAGIKKNTLRNGRFSCVDMGNNADIPHAMNGVRSRHKRLTAYERCKCAVRFSHAVRVKLLFNRTAFVF